jgi:hypothetical protein
MALAINAIKTNVIKGDKVSIETNSKGAKITWLRLKDEIKDNGSYIVTSKDNTEYAAMLPAPDIESGINWLFNNQGLENVRDWFKDQFTRVNRPLIATAGASGTEVELIGDIESLIAFDTLESARGRKASSLNSDQWKAYSPILADCLKRFFEEKKAQNVSPLVNKYLNLIKGAIYHFSPIGDNSTMEKASSMIEYTFEWVIGNKPELETIAAFAVTVMENNKKKYSTDGESEY